MVLPTLLCRQCPLRHDSPVWFAIRICQTAIFIERDPEMVITAPAIYS